MSLSSTTSNSTTNSLKELCVICQVQPYDLICTCGDKFDFTCIHSHVEQLGIEFEFIQNQVGEKLLNIEAIVEDIDCSNAKAIIENWKRKRMQDINDIAEDALNEIYQREKAYSEVGPLRVQFNTLCEGSHRVVHEQLDFMVAFQRQILDKSEELQNLPDLIRDDVQLDSEIQLKLNPLVFKQNHLEKLREDDQLKKPEEDYQLEKLKEDDQLESISLTTMDTNLSASSESNPTIYKNLSTNFAEIMSTSETSTINDSPSSKSVPQKSEDTQSEEDEFDAGRTASIQRQNVVIIPVNNDRHLATICCHNNQLLYNDIDKNNQNPCLTFLSDINQITNKQIIEWIPSDTTVSGGDDAWIQDIIYSNKLQGYLLLTRARLRFLPENSLEIEDYVAFPDRSMKRVTCNEKYLFLISANGVTGRNGDEIIVLNDDKEEVICKTFRDLVISRNQRSNNSFVGEISDLAVNTNDQLIFSYRLERRQEVGIRMYKISSNGQEWLIIKQLLLNECWHDDLSYTPRIEWCEKYHLFILVEYLTSHLIMINKEGQVKGENLFLSVNNQKDSPLNLSISNDDWLCIRYETSINIHQLENDRF